MADKSYLFNFVVNGIDTLAEGIGKATDKAKDAAKEVKKLKENFSSIYADQRKDGVGVFKSLGTAVRGAVVQAGGLLKILHLLTRVGAGGILLFFASKTFQTNMGGIASAFARIQAAFGQMWGKLNIAINQFMRDIGPALEPIIKGIANALVAVIKALSWMIDTFMKAPKAIRILVGGLALLATAFWALSANPFFIVLAGAVTLIYLLYKGIKAIVDLFKKNSKMNMDASLNYGGRAYQVLGKGGNTSSDNSINHTTNNVYLQGSGNGMNDAKLISNELSTLKSINRTTG